MDCWLSVEIQKPWPRVLAASWRTKRWRVIALRAADARSKLGIGRRCLQNGTISSELPLAKNRSAVPSIRDALQVLREEFQRGIWNDQRGDRRIPKGFRRAAPTLGMARHRP